MRKDTFRLVPVERIESRILVVRGHRVLLDSELALLYGVTTKRLNEQVRRNRGRFPEDFVFRVTPEEEAALRSQNSTSKGRGGRRYRPYVFTEHGALMAASVLNSPTAIAVSIEVVRTFVRLRHWMNARGELSRRLNELESKYAAHDGHLAALFDAVRRLIEPPEDAPKKGRIGFARADRKA